MLDPRGAASPRALPVLGRGDTALLPVAMVAVVLAAASTATLATEVEVEADQRLPDRSRQGPGLGIPADRERSRRRTRALRLPVVLLLDLHPLAIAILLKLPMKWSAISTVAWTNQPYSCIAVICWLDLTKPRRPERWNVASASFGILILSPKTVVKTMMPSCLGRGSISPWHMRRIPCTRKPARRTPTSQGRSRSPRLGRHR
mmetsp:Transcript_10681/g.22615  ORF Transcript_10681/g.22615 Transcript_10681/m.22615 type:complete len:203 (+) Transcript_10681:133-741(+)